MGLRNITQETPQERIYREAFEEIKRVCDTQEHVDNHLLRFFITKKMMEIENLPITTDKLSVEKLQEQLNITKKALTEIYLDVNETIIDPVFLFHQSQRIAGRALNELGENNEISKTTGYGSRGVTWRL